MLKIVSRDLRRMHWLAYLQQGATTSASRDGDSTGAIPDMITWTIKKKKMKTTLASIFLHLERQLLNNNK